jgi:catechol 2,3-dioxygenase-like lactoylglutathione lyase family enzyme
MQSNIISIRPFIGAKDFDISRKFYTDFGFAETILSAELSVFTLRNISFYLQKAYIKDWIDNTMIFVQVANVVEFHQEISSLEITIKYPSTRVSNIKHDTWGDEFFVHDPSGILWHFGQFH